MTDVAVIWAAAVSAGPSTLAAVLSYRAVRHGRQNMQAIATVSGKADDNNQAIKQVERQTNGMLTARIREVLRDELIQHAGVTAEIYDLIDAIVSNALGLTENGNNNEA